MSLTNFVDQLDAPSSFPSLADFSAAVATDALKWTDLEQNVVYQIVYICTVNTQHGQSVFLSLQNPMMMAISRLFVLATGQKTSKSGRVYNSYQLLKV